MGVEAALIGGGAILGSSYLSSKSAERSANAAAAGMQAQGQAQIEAARIAADAAKFRPYNISTALGGVRFGDQTVDITYNPALAKYRERLFGLATSTLPEDIRAAEEEEYRRLVAGSRGALEQQTAALGSGLFRSGRQGLDIYGANPELRAFAAAQMDRELALRQAAEQQIANRIAQSTGLFTSGVGVEQAMLQPLDIGAQLGGRQAQAGAAAGQLITQGAANAANLYGNAANLRMQGGLVGPTMMGNTIADLARNPQFTQGIQGLFGNIQQRMSPTIYGSGNVYGPYGTGTVPTLNPNPAFGSAEYFAYDL